MLPLDNTGPRKFPASSPLAPTVASGPRFASLGPQQYELLQEFSNAFPSLLLLSLRFMAPSLAFSPAGYLLTNLTFVCCVVFCQQSSLLPKSTTIPTSENGIAPRFAPQEQQPAELIVGPVDVAPIGWRLTNRGWERAETWGLVPESPKERINGLIRQQKSDESSSVGLRRCAAVLSFVQRLDPLVILVIQLMMLVFLVSIVFNRQKKRLLATAAIPPVPQGTKYQFNEQVGKNE